MYQLGQHTSISTTYTHTSLGSTNFTSIIMTTAPFWVIAQRVVIISYRRFGTVYRSHIEGSRLQFIAS